MNYFRRAWLCLWRLPVKTGILFGIFFLSSVVMLGTLLARQGISQVEQDLLSRLPSISTPQWTHPFYDDPWELRQVLVEQRLSSDLVQQIGNISGVQAFDASLNVSAFSSELRQSGSAGEVDMLSVYTNSFELRGVSNPEITEVEAGIIELVYGRVFAPEEIHSNRRVAVVSEVFARENNFSVGSTFELFNSVHDYPKMGFEGGGNFTILRHLEEFMLANEVLEFEIIGIFDFIAQTDMDDLDLFMGDSLEQLKSTIYIPFQVAEDIFQFQYENLTPFFDEWAEIYGTQVVDLIPEFPRLDVLFILESVYDIAPFYDQVSALLPEYWELVDNRLLFEDVINTMDEMRTVSNFILVMVSSAFTIALTLLIWLFLYDRRQEIGIYRALGSSSKHIILQILSEIGLLFLGATTLSFAFGRFFAQMMGNYLTRMSFNREVTLSSWLPRNLDLVNIAWIYEQQSLFIYDISLRPGTLLLFMGIGSIVLLLPSILIFTYILKFNPKDLLKAT